MSGRGAAITGWGTALPEKVLTNHDLEQTLDTSDSWIVERSGIRQRYVGCMTSDLAIEASQQALERAGLAPADIGLLILATTTPDQTVPATSAAVQDRLGLTCGAFDLNAACSGFVYSLVVANSMVDSGVDKLLLIGAESLSRITDWTDRSTAVLFGDGAGAFVLEAEASGPHLLGWDLGADGSARGILYTDVGGT